MKLVIVKRHEQMTRAILEADRIVVRGAVHGHIEAGDIEVESTAQVSGTILYGTLRIAVGARVDAVFEHRG